MYSHFVNQLLCLRSRRFVIGRRQLQVGLEVTNGLPVLAQVTVGKPPIVVSFSVCLTGSALATPQASGKRPQS